MNSDPVTDIVKELADRLPIKEAYNDALSPSMKQAGKLLEDLSKTIRLALFPVQVGAALQDKFASFLAQSVEKVPEKQRIAPPPQILGPVLEGIKYEDEEGPIWEMFSNLLSKGMDKSSPALAHPAFPALVKQLAPDEARMLHTMYSLPEKKARLKFRLKPGTDDTDLSNWKVERDDFGRDTFAAPNSFDLYQFHLVSLDLMGQAGQSGEGYQEHEFTLTPLGDHFMRAVTASMT